MDSEGEEHFYSMDSEEENFNYSSGDDEKMDEAKEDCCEEFDYSSGNDDGMEEVEEEYGDLGTYSNTKKDYIILNEGRIRQLQENDISEVSSVLSVTRGMACSLLLRGNWNLTSVIDKWLANDEGVREAIIISEKIKSMKLENYCKICLETVEITMLSAGCGHAFCANCWKTYFTASINDDGPGCLKLRCPEPKCKAVAGLDMMESVASEDERTKYNLYLYRSYVECSKNRKWCPAPGCEYAIEFAAGGCESYVVTCDCSYKFCWKCTEECHRPVDCETVAKWIKKNNAEGQNVNWIAAYTKPCPRCNRPIQKDLGCNHMTCENSCKFEFCWLCLEPWNSYTAGKCNTYNYEKEQESLNSIRKHLEKFAHYYERWVSNNRSRTIALADMSRAQNEYIPMISLMQKESEKSLQFVMEAWEQIVESRGVLKWTYAYGYYMDEDNLEKKTFFEYLQGEAEFALERLHHCAETEMVRYISENSCSQDFMDFQAKLICLTSVTRNYFQNLVRAMENQLSEFDYAGTSRGKGTIDSS